MVKIVGEEKEGILYRVFKGMAVLAFGTVVARAFTLVSMPLLARIYTDENFGVLSMYTALVMVSTPFLSLRYVTALPLPRSNALAVNLLAASFVVILISGSILSALVFLFGQDLLGLMNMELLAPWLWLVVIGAIGAAIYELLSMWATRERRYALISKTVAKQSLIGESAKVILGLLSLKGYGLLIGQFLSMVSGSVQLFFNFKRDSGRLIKKVTGKRMGKAVYLYRGFPLYRMPSQAMLVLSQQLPVMAIAAMYGASEVGQFSLAFIAVMLPVNLLSQNISKSFYAEIANGRRDRSILSIMARVSAVLVLVAIFPACLLYYYSEPLFSIFLGEGWELSAVIARNLSFYAFFLFVSVPFVTVFNILKKQSIYLLVNGIRLLVIVFVFFVFPEDVSVDELVLVYSLSMSFFFLFVFVCAFFCVYQEAKGRGAC